jgi:hypothetical protein
MGLDRAPPNTSRETCALADAAACAPSGRSVPVFDQQWHVEQRHWVALAGRRGNRIERSQPSSCGDAGSMCFSCTLRRWTSTPGQSSVSFLNCQRLPKWWAAHIPPVDPYDAERVLDLVRNNQIRLTPAARPGTT